jgi:hypothetical protein
MLRNKPSIERVLPDFLAFLGQTTLVGHNIESFDYPVLKRVARDLKLIPPAGPVIDTYKLARRLLPHMHSHRLEALAKMWKITDQDQTHRALDDVCINAGVFARLLDCLDAEREVDIMNEVLPLVALGIHGIDFPHADYHYWLAQAGARARTSGVGLALCEQLGNHVHDIWELDACERWVDGIDSSDDEEDQRWEALAHRWDEALNVYERTCSDQTLAAFLRYVNLATCIDQVDGEDDRVTMLTIHTAKGKEWPVVFLLGVEDGTIPLYGNESTEALNEEGRVLYVAMTRAVKRLCLTYVTNRKGYRTLPSRFLDALPESLIDRRNVR